MKRLMWIILRNIQAKVIEMNYGRRHRHLSMHTLRQPAYARLLETFVNIIIKVLTLLQWHDRSIGEHRSYL